MQNYSDSNQTSQDSGRPYTDLEITKDYIIREFDQNIDPIELMWHRDQEDRLIEVLEGGKGWSIQQENELPLDVSTPNRIFIPKYQWHRVHKGEDKLKIKIYKTNG